MDNKYDDTNYSLTRKIEGTERIFGGIVTQDFIDNCHVMASLSTIARIFDMYFLSSCANTDGIVRTENIDGEKLKLLVGNVFKPNGQPQVIIELFNMIKAVTEKRDVSDHYVIIDDSDNDEGIVIMGVDLFKPNEPVNLPKSDSFFYCLRRRLFNRGQLHITPFQAGYGSMPWSTSSLSIAESVLNQDPNIQFGSLELPYIESYNRKNLKVVKMSEVLSE